MEEEMKISELNYKKAYLFLFNRVENILQHCLENNVEKNWLANEFYGILNLAEDIAISEPEQSADSAAEVVLEN